MENELSKIVQDSIDSINNQIELVYYKAVIKDFSSWFVIIYYNNPFLTRLFPINAKIGGLESL